MKWVLDSGALIALERGERAMWRRVKGAWLRGEDITSHGGVVGQVWRGLGPREALLSRALSGVDVRPLDDPLGRAAGKLLRRSGSVDVIDAALALLAEDGDVVVTSDPDDLESLLVALDRHVDIVAT